MQRTTGRDNAPNGSIAEDRKARLGKSAASAAAEDIAPQPGGLRAQRDNRITAKYAVEFLLIGSTYFVLAKIGLTLASIHPSATPIWPPTGFALAAILLWGHRVWPAIFLAALVANATTAGSFFTSVAIAAGNTLEALVGSYLINRWSDGRRTFETPAGVARFALISLAVSTPISATIGVASLTLAGFADQANVASIWTTWWLGDLAGALVITPVIMLWVMSGFMPVDRRPALESAAIFIAASAVGLLAFSPLIEQTIDRGPLGFLAILPLLWAALRRGQRDTATAAFILACFAVWGTLAGGGPFAWSTLNESFLLLLMFMISTSVPSLALSADVAIRKRTEENLRDAHDLLDQRVRERTATLGATARALEIEIEQKKRAEAELTQQSVHLLEAQRLANLGSWRWDVAANRVTWSQQLFEIYGIGYEEFRGTFEDFLQRVHESDRPRVEEEIRQAFREKRGFQIDERIVRPNGEIRHLQSCGEVIKDENGNIVQMLGICQDVTDRMQAVSALRETKEALHQARKVEALGQLTGGIAHDFNNVLAAITNNLELILATGNGNEKQRKRVERALQAARNGAALIQQLLVFARRQPLDPRPADINEIVKSSLALFHRGCPENIKVRPKLAPDLKWANVDLSQLQTAILNLVLNSRDAMPDGGTVTITTANFHSTAAATLSPGDFVSITVTDTGTGMTAEVLERAVEPFFTTKGIGKGTGLGLTMVYSSVRQMGGDVYIESTPGQGTTVRMILPAHSGAKPSTVDDAQPVAEIAPSITEPISILYVEDDALVSLATVDILQDGGYSTYVAPDAKRALVLLEEHPEIELMVTDVGLPGVSGQELAAEARRHRPSLKVLFITGYDRSVFISKMPPDAITEYLGKPYQPQEINGALRRLLGTARHSVRSSLEVPD